MRSDNNTPSTNLRNRAATTKAMRTKLWMTGLLGLFGFGTISYVAGSWITDVAPDKTAWFALFLATFAGFVTFYWSMFYWRNIDEMARRAHLDSLFWGWNFSGILLFPLGMVALKFSSFELPIIEAFAASPTQAFGLGVTFAIGATIVLYGVWWLFWWVTKR